jgi:predicted MPP superfamily phosphohydrolase
MVFHNAGKNKIFFFGFFSACLLLLALATYGIWIEPNEVEVHHVSITSKYLGEILQNRIVVQISDLHIRKIGKREQKVLEILNVLEPDIIFLTGDYVRWRGAYAPALKFLSLLHAKIGVWAVMGDYDYSRSRNSCLFCHEEGSGSPMRQHSVRFLRDSMELVSFPEGTLRIEGVDGEGGSLFSPERKLLSSDNGLPRIILSHSPLNFDLISDNDDVLMLAGDTHGGQVPLPGWLFRVLGYKKNALYNQGLFEKGRKSMYVSRGIGTSHLPFRLFRTPEVVVFHFKPQ